MNDDSKFCFGLKLNVGLITPKEIQTWADKKILEDNNDQFVLDICYLNSDDVICAELAGDFHLGYARQLTDKSSLLLVQPDKGDLIKNGGGIRKVRCAQSNKGKSGGIRVIYYWVNEDDQIFFLVAYPKSVKDNLTDKETAILRQLVKEQFHG